MVFDQLHALLLLKFQKRFEKQFLPVSVDALACVNDLNSDFALLKLQILGILVVLQLDADDNFSLRLVVLDCVLEKVEENQVEDFPVGLQAAAVGQLDCHQHLYFLLFDFDFEGVDDCLELVKQIFGECFLVFKLLFLNFHSLDLVLVEKPHKHARVIYCLRQLQWPQKVVAGKRLV